MRLDEKAWVLAGGAGPQWRWVHGRRVAQALADLERIERELARRGPAGVRRGRFAEGLRFVARDRSPARERLLSHPALDYWLYLWQKHFGAPCDESQWRLQFGLFGGLAAGLALSRRASLEVDAAADPDAHLHLYGTRLRVELPKPLALATLRLSARGGALSIEGPDGLRLRLPRCAEKERTPLGRGASLVRCREVIPGVSVEDCGFLTVQCVVIHTLAHPDARAEERFAAVLATALAHVRERDEALFAEMADMTRVLVPLENPMRYGSVSSSYVNLRGAICLSHAEDPLLQAETLIHEFCHQKMNQLLLADPILLPGQSGQVFYSPWRPDARRLRGLILGAHAFLNVAHYLMRSLSRESYPLRGRIAVMCNVARRLYEVEAALRSACAYGEFTEFGRRFVLLMWKETQLLFHAAQWFPPALMKEARLAYEAHRRQHGLALTGFHRTRGFSSTIRHAPFGQKRIIRRRLPELAEAQTPKP